jgi:hypothetical protein
MRGLRGFRAGLPVAVLAAAVGVAGCGGAPRQDADEPSGTFRVEVVSASFPSKQSIADANQLKIRVRNADDKALPNVAVTLETKVEGQPGSAPSAFTSDVNDPRLADRSRPIWIVDKSPAGGDTAYVNTWALGRLAAGAEKTFTWDVTAVKPGSYTIDYAVSPGLTGKGKPAAGAGTGTLRVRIDERPPDASVDAAGNVVRSSPD